MMTDQKSRAETFASLHVEGDPLILFNIWDAGSAMAVEKAGAKALATGSWPVAAAFGFPDGEKLPFDLALDNIRRIVSGTALPVTMDIESGYGVSPREVAATANRAVEAGAIGFNLEDQVIGGEGIYAADVQHERIAAARAACDKLGVPAFINARTDIFLKAPPETHSEDMLADAIVRAHDYEQAGASGFFAPGLTDQAMIETLCREVNLPVNIIALPHVPDKATLASLGVARISYGPVPYRQMMASLDAAAKAAFS